MRRREHLPERGAKDAGTASSDPTSLRRAGGGRNQRTEAGRVRRPQARHGGQRAGDQGLRAGQRSPLSAPPAGLVPKGTPAGGDQQDRHKSADEARGGKNIRDGRKGHTMRAMVLREQGETAWPTLEDNLPDPVLGDSDVLVRVRATSLNYHDVFTRRGMPGIKIVLPAILG